MPPPPDRRAVKALGHPLRLRILELVVQAGEASPVRMAKALDQPLSTVSKHVRMLRDLGFLELTRTAPRRGALEHFYRARRLALIEDEEWAQLPVSLRRGLVGQIFRTIFSEASEAGGLGGFDAPEMHLDRVSLRLDERGRRQLSELLRRTVQLAEVIQRRSDERAAPGTEPSTLALLHFRSQPEPGSSPSRPPLP